MNEFARRGFIFAGAAAVAGAILFAVERIGLSAFASSDESASLAAGPVTIVRFDNDGRNLGSSTVPKIIKTRSQWKAQLTSQQFAVTRGADTEFAYSGELNKQYSPGLYRCIDCDSALFDSSTKFDSGTGWPSFWAPIAAENVTEKKGMSFGVLASEIKCTLCDAHLGHVFDDGPAPTGLRYCMNSAALRFVSRKS